MIGYLDVERLPTAVWMLKQCEPENRFLQLKNLCVNMAFEDWNATFNLDWSFDYDTGFSLDFLVPGVIRVASLAAA